jgi:acetoacetate decarboxylase
MSYTAFRASMDRRFTRSRPGSEDRAFYTSVLYCLGDSPVDALAYLQEYRQKATNPALRERYDTIIGELEAAQRENEIGGKP